MSDPFSVAVRRYIPWSEYRALEETLSVGSLTGRIAISLAEIEARLQTLRQYEAQSGFVFFGEGKWLDDRVAADNEMSYGDWVANQLVNGVFVNRIAYVDDATNGSCWKAYSENLSLFWSPPELA